jgi:hypothetical protein
MQLDRGLTSGCRAAAFHSTIALIMTANRIRLNKERMCAWNDPADEALLVLLRGLSQIALNASFDRGEGQGGAPRSRGHDFGTYVRSHVPETHAENRIQGGSMEPFGQHRSGRLADHAARPIESRLVDSAMRANPKIDDDNIAASLIASRSFDLSTWDRPPVSRVVGVVEDSLDVLL